MSEEIAFDNLRDYNNHELIQIIDNQLSIIATLQDYSDNEFRTYEDELADINVVKANAYKLIFVTQKKLLKLVKQYEQGNTDNQKV